jgi:uncharacterized protein (DUF1800 family)
MRKTMDTARGHARNNTDDGASETTTAPTKPLTRRGLLAGGTAAGVAVASAGLAPAADAATADGEAKAYLPKVRPYRKTVVPDVAARHMANRFAYGYTPELRKQIHAAGGPQKWFERQLHPQKIPDARADRFDAWFPSRHRTPKVSWAHAEKGAGYVWQAECDHARWALLRRTYSNRQVHERMTEFWLNHLHVYGHTDLAWMWRTGYDKVIRKHALGKFDAMLREAITHPTMILYLDADMSQAGELNENLGRELLELHTVGREAGYTEAMVQDSARILTGYYVDRFRSWEFSYVKSRHATGPVRVLGFSHDNAKPDGRQALREYLHYLAHHPATAQRIARKLAVRFVSDDPSQGLVDHLADVFQRTGTDIAATLRALVAHPEFKKSVGAKVKTPTEDVVSTLRAYGVKLKRPRREADASNAIFYVCRLVGQVPFGWGPPNGFPDTANVWTSPGRMMGSYHVHYSLAGGWWPNTGVEYRRHASWLPQKRIRFDQFVDHLCRVLHGRPATPRVLGAACIATDTRPGTVISAGHYLIQSRLPKLMGILLDTPQFMTR